MARAGNRSSNSQLILTFAPRLPSIFSILRNSYGFSRKWVDESIEIESRDTVSERGVSLDESLARNETFVLPCHRSFIPAKSSLIRRSPRQQKLLRRGRRQVQNDILAAGCLRVKKQNEQKKKQGKERRKEVFYLFAR